MVPRASGDSLDAGHHRASAGGDRGGGGSGACGTGRAGPAVRRRSGRKRGRGRRPAARCAGPAPVAVRRVRRPVRGLRQPPGPAAATCRGSPGPVRLGCVGRRRQRPARRADGGHGVLPRRRPRRPLGGGDQRLECHLATPARPGDRADRPGRRAGPGRRRTARTRRTHLPLRAARLRGRAGPVAHGGSAGRRVLRGGVWVGAGLARRARKPVHRPRSLVSNPARTLQDR